MDFRLRGRCLFAKQGPQIFLLSSRHERRSQCATLATSTWRFDSLVMLVLVEPHTILMALLSVISKHASKPTNPPYLSKRMCQ
jgi:hypothetical protein